MMRLFVVRATVKQLVLLAGSLFMAGCDALLDVKDSEGIDIAGKSFEAFSATFPPDRESLGFPVLPKTGQAKVLYLNKSAAKEYGCDLMLRMPVSTNGLLREWVFAFEKQAGSLKFLAEDVQYQGPNFYIPEEKLRETINITRRVRPVLKSTAIGLRISYSGPNKDLSFKALTPDEIKPIVKEWAKVMPYP